MNKDNEMNNSNNANTSNSNDQTINDQKLLNYLSLAFSYGVGPATFLKLIQHFTTVNEIMTQNLASLSAVIGKGVAESILNKKSMVDAESALLWRDQNPLQRRIICLEDSYYPPELAEIAQPPIILFAEGNWELLRNPKIAVVGTRHPTPQGVENARGFAQELSANGLTVVSGLAAGIDRYAHEGALLANQASTIGVIGTGMDLIYPSSNRDVYRRLAKDGLILSEYSLGTPPNTSNFPRRNRIVVGLSKACLVIESAIDGGSMISANFALEMGREVMAIPGSIHNPMARGCHKLIKQGAKLCETANDVLEELQFINNQLMYNEINDSNADPILSALGYDPQTIDSLSAKLTMEFGELCGKLLELELAGLVYNCGGGRYQRIFR